MPDKPEKGIDKVPDGSDRSGAPDPAAANKEEQEATRKMQREVEDERRKGTKPPEKEDTGQKHLPDVTIDDPGNKAASNQKNYTSPPPRPDAPSGPSSPPARNAQASQEPSSPPPRSEAPQGPNPNDRSQSK